MSSREFFIGAIEDELPRFERVLKAVPESGLDYRPHEKCRTARELIGLFADESQMFGPILNKGEIDLAGAAPSRSPSAADAVAALTRGLNAAREAARSTSEETWGSPARFLVNGKVEWETTREKMAWGLLLDLIHHRGQLSVYLRPMGAKVPAIYGPSGDANG